jgi:hypothetical protein
MIIQKRTRERDIPDWVQTCPGWYAHSVIRNAAGVVTSDMKEVKTLKPSDRANGPKSYEVTHDENHSKQMKSFKSFQFAGDIGGEFDLYRQVISAHVEQSHLHKSGPFGTGTKTDDYFGPLYMSTPSLSTIALPSNLGLTNLAPIGTKAIAFVKPTNNVANLATDLVEIRQEGLPHLQGASLWEEKTLNAKAAGSEYLNQEFGWSPLVSDVRGASYAAANASKLLAAYERNSHKITRRRYEFPTTRTESWSQFATGAHCVSNQQLSLDIVSQYPLGKVYKQTIAYTRRWFSGAFTYHLPLGFKSRYKLIRAGSKAGPLLGIELTPEVVWNATPWTWALDWFSDTGDVVSTYSDMAVDGLVIKYGYIMEHTRHEDNYYFVPDTLANVLPGSSIQLPFYSVLVETKRRRRATPFGFEIGWNGLSFRQLAIAAALGITRW